MIGEIVGCYRLLQKLGEGSMGEVFLGQHTQSGEQAAVKLLFPTFSRQGMALTRYFAEVRSTNVLGHPSIATIYECGTHTNGRAFLCMEFLAGRSLAAALVDMPIGDPATLNAIGTQVAGALEGVHGRRMVHRALKPDSIFLTAPMPRPTVKLLDFGVANFTQSVRQSQTGSLLGAPLYMSPEVGRGLGNVDHRADIYSLGCILFELATGRPPFVREGAGELIVAHSTEVPPSAKDLEPSLSPALDSLLARMLRKEPAQRPQSMLEVVAALRACMIPAGVPVPVFAPTPGLVTPSPAARSMPPFAAPATPTTPTTPSAPPLSPAPRPLPATGPSPFAALAASSASVSPRHPDATVLLAPTGGDAASALEPSPSRHSTRKSLRPVQPTALLDPPTPRKPRSRSLPVFETEHGRHRRSTLPLFLVGGAALLCIVAVILVLVVGRSSTSLPAATASRRAPAREQFTPPATDIPSTPTKSEKLQDRASSPPRPDHATKPTAADEDANERSVGAPSRHRSHPSKANDSGKAPPRLDAPTGSGHW
jgi:serine/threonine-protein kinase